MLRDKRNFGRGIRFILRKDMNVLGWIGDHMNRIAELFIIFFSLCTLNRAIFIQTLNLSDLSSADTYNITFSSSLKSIINYTKILDFPLPTSYKNQPNYISSTSDSGVNKL
jgi:hypothetical protein